MAVAFTFKEASDWRAAVDFLRAHNAQFKSIRDDVGGHFLERAADYALSDMGSHHIGVLTIREGTVHNSAACMLEFAGEIVAVAMTRHKGEKEAKEFFEDTINLLVEALRHITLQVHVLTYHYLWPRFGA